jgi:hypothetical protein
MVLSLSVRPACAQSSDSHPVSSGFWVVESNLATPRIVTVRYYEEGNRLIDEEHLTGVRMDVSKRGTRRRLDQRLRDALALEKVRAADGEGPARAAGGQDPPRADGVSWNKER